EPVPGCEELQLFLDPPAEKAALNARELALDLQRAFDNVDIEVDLTTPGTRGRCEVQLGWAWLRASWTGDGHGSLEFAIPRCGGPAAYALRRGRWHHNEQVLSWIQSLGDSHLTPAVDSSAEAEDIEDGCWP